MSSDHCHFDSPELYPKHIKVGTYIIAINGQFGLCICHIIRNILGFFVTKTTSYIFYTVYKKFGKKITMMPTNMKVNFCARFRSGCINNNLEDVRSAMDEYEKCLPAKPLHEVVIGCPQYNLVNYVAKHSSPEILALVLEKKAYRIINDGGYCWTPLHCLALRKPNKRKDIKAMVKMLCDVGYDVNAKVIKDLTPLYFACVAKDSLEIVKALVQGGANINDKVLSKKTLLDICVLQRKPDIFLYFLQNGADLDVDVIRILYFILDGFQNGGHLEMFKYLIAYGIDLNKLPQVLIGCLLKPNSVLKYEQIREIYELLQQSGYKFTDSLLEKIKWIKPKQGVLTLQRLSSNRIREYLAPNLYQKLKTLDGKWLPRNVIDYIMLKHL